MAKQEQGIEEEVQETWLTTRQEKFCQLYCTDYSMNGNWVYCYAKAYWMDITIPESYASAGASASRLLKNVIIRKRLRDLLDLHINTEVVDHELAKLIVQDEDKQVKRAAIRDWNELAERIKKKIDITWEIKTSDLKNVPTSDLIKELEKIKAAELLAWAIASEVS